MIGPCKNWTKSSWLLPYWPETEAESIMLAKLVTTSTVQTQLVDSTVTLSILVVTTVNLALKWLTSRRLRPMGGCLAP